MPTTAPGSGSSPRQTAPQRRCCSPRIIDSPASLLWGKPFFSAIRRAFAAKRSAVRASSESNQTRSDPRKRVDGRKRVTVNADNASQTPKPSTAPPARVMSKEYKLVALRECPLPESMQICDTPEGAADYWRLTIATNPYFNPECECFAVLLLNTRKRVKGHQLISIGTLDTILVHPREVFRGAILAAASAVVLMHNHPSGEPQPSEADIKVTRDLIRAGQLLKIEVLDHVIMGNPSHCSLRELGYFYQ